MGPSSLFCITYTLSQTAGFFFSFAPDSWLYEERNTQNFDPYFPNLCPQSSKKTHHKNLLERPKTQVFFKWIL